MAFSDENCTADYTSAPAKLPYDKTKCTGASQIKIVWLALHSSTWQAYINCATLASGSDSSMPTAATTPAPTPSSAASPSTSTSDNEYDSTPAPATTPSPTSAAADDEYASTPSPTKKKCTAKTSRMRRS